MAEKVIKISLLALLTVCLLYFGESRADCNENTKVTSQKLSSQAFSGILDGREKIELIGGVSHLDFNYCIYFYAREFGNRRLAKRLVILDGNDGRYVGMFDVNDKPKGIVGNSIIFDYHDDLGNKIVVGPSGFPKNTYLDGEPKELFK
ncbi:hypothetical protein [Pseudoalteromonas sp. OOF1S-7]|uniref:hypothetical protein n=1 Tax=Pseudoalteromonas sp. OOF1S-7 TaxID=2917757 RepID=UPI001EF70757|nr:hypothetical protein [Pseudoalteromonas sp. OOF1S-7]MCG7537890.1 hypothetical protein [Pseudoalteromonas sp. OOF1S-7]